MMIQRRSTTRDNNTDGVYRYPSLRVILPLNTRSIILRNIVIVFCLLVTLPRPMSSFSTVASVVVGFDVSIVAHSHSPFHSNGQQIRRRIGHTSSSQTVLLLAPIPTVTGRRRHNAASSSRSLGVVLSAHSVTTALERVWDERRLRQTRTSADTSAAAVAAAADDDDDDDCINNNKFYRQSSLSWLDMTKGDDSSSSSSSSPPFATTTIIGSNNNDDDEEGGIRRVPLYPLHEVYLPTYDYDPNNTNADDWNNEDNGHDNIHAPINHTLNNVEPQNIQMVLDLLSANSNSSSSNNDNDNNTTMESGKDRKDATKMPMRFCTVLRCIDSGRIASIGTMMRIVHIDMDYHHPRDVTTNTNDDDDDTNANTVETIARIRVTCRAEGLVNILRVENGSYWKDDRLRKSNRYLWSDVKPVLLVNENEHENADNNNNNKNNNSNNTTDETEIYQQLIHDLHEIKLMYQLELGADKLPYGMMFRLGNAMKDFSLSSSASASSASMAAIDHRSSTRSTVFWSMAQEWQSVCMTHREGQQIILGSDRNEHLVAAARQQLPRGEILTLPIHIEDIQHPRVRERIQYLDVQAQTYHEQSHLDPILDFQLLFGLPTITSRYKYLAILVSRERQRLLQLASSYTSPSVITKPDDK